MIGISFIEWKYSAKKGEIDKIDKKTNSILMRILGFLTKPLDPSVWMNNVDFKINISIRITNK